MEKTQPAEEKLRSLLCADTNAESVHREVVQLMAGLKLWASTLSKMYRILYEVTLGKTRKRAV